MTPQERMIANQDFIDGIEVRVAALEKQLRTGLRVGLDFIGCAKNQIDFVWPMGFEEDHVRLRALKARLNSVKRLNPPEPEMPLVIHLFG